jgi:hypothetical protein
MSPGINTERLRRVRDRIVAEPERFDMGDYARPVFSPEGVFLGTVHCIGGLAAIDAGYIVARGSRDPERMVWYDITAASPVERYPYDDYRFAEALSLIPDEANRLFGVDQWPAPFNTEYALAGSPEVRASVASRRIDRFIRTRGRE